LSKILPFSGLGPGSGSVSQNGQKPTLLMKSLTKKTKVFFSVLTRRLVESFEVQNNSLAQLPGKLWHCYNILKTWEFAPATTSSEGVNLCMPG